MTALRQIPIGSMFLLRDKFEGGQVRDHVGIKIGETTEIWDAVKWLKKLHYHPDGAVRWSFKGPAFTLVDSRVSVTQDGTALVRLEAVQAAYEAKAF